MLFTCEKCGLEQQSTPAPCPDNRPGCCEAHYDKKSFLCSECGADNTPDWENMTWFEEVGVAIINTAALEKLEFKP